MAQRMQVPELRCMEPENYKKYFRALCWSGTKKERRSHKRIGKKEKLRRLKAANALAVCYAPALLGNPSQFAVYANVRKSILARWRHLHGTVNELSDDSDTEDATPPQTNKIPKITGIGLRSVFSLIAQARFTNAQFCEQALIALLDVLQGHAPEELAQEPTDIILNLHSMLVEVASGSGPNGKVELPTTLTALSSSCLIALSVARGEAELILSAVASLIMSPSVLSEQDLQIPSNLITLQRSVQSVILGSPSRNLWLNYGVPHQCLVNSFPVDLPAQLTGSGELVVRSLVSDGCFLYVYTSKGLLKIGSGYGSSIRQHVYMHKPDFFASDRHGWLGYCKNKLYLRIGRKKTEVYEIDRETLEVRNLIRLDPGQPAPVEPKSAVFTDGNQLGLILLTNFDNLTIRLYDADCQPERDEGTATTTLTSQKEINVHLLRRRTLILGRSPFEDGMSRRATELDAPIAMQLDDNDDDPLLSIYGGQDFALLTTTSGKVYYTGKGASLGYKAASPQTGRWTLMKETIFSRNEAPNAKRCKVMQVAVGHEGVHAILVLDNGSALFTGIARRGEDGDAMKHRRQPKPTRPKKIFKAEGHFVVYAACNNGSTALVTRQGHLLMFGKDTQHCDSAGQVLGLRHERIVQVALGKAHAVALTNFGQVYTFGINNKGQCGREFGYTKEKMFPSSRRRAEPKEESRLCATSHTWTTDYCRVCVLCRDCTGFSSACHCSHLPNRVPGEKCGCGEGDSGCAVCGVCRRCADAFVMAGRPERSSTVTVTDLDDDGEPSIRPDSRSDFDNNCAGASSSVETMIDIDDIAEVFAILDTRSDKENVRFSLFEGAAASSEMDRDASLKVTCLPPARVAVPGGHRIMAVACGLHHTVLLTEHGDVLTFGSNQYGQLGAGDIAVHHRIVRVRVPKASSIAAGSNHTAVLTREGELYTFGSYQKGSLGRPRMEEPLRSDRSPIWYATPGRVPRLGPRHSCRAVWVSASGDQTFVQVSQALIKTDTLFSSTITANSNTIIILPNRPEHTFKCITINKMDGTCNTWPGSEQVDFVNSLACLDPLYDVLWCYQPQMRVMKCYNILAFDSHKLQKCCNDPESYFGDGDFEYPNYGSMKRLEDFKNLENFDLSCRDEDRPTDNVALSNMSVLNQELAIPSAIGYSVTRMHAALHLLGCLDSLTYAHDIRLNQSDSKRDSLGSPILPVKEDYQTVNRFESNGGGWGYSGHSVEAIRFMCDTDILLGGIGLYGGRGDYTAKVKLYDIGIEGGDQEGDGELITESDEIIYECPPRDRFPVMFDNPVPLAANRWYVAWACISGPSSDCGSSGQAMVINDEIGFHFKTSKKSNNGTDVNAGQIPCFIYNTVSPDQSLPLKVVELGDPIIVLSKNLSRKVTVSCFKSLITLLQWSWDTFKQILLETNGLVPINYQKLTVMKHQKRLVYVIRACLRLVKSYINEIYPQNNRKRNSHEYMSYFEAIAEVRNLIQTIMADQTPTCSMLPRKPGKTKAHRVCYVQFALELITSILNEAHDTITACFHAFFPTPTLKWNHLCSMLFNVKEGVVPATQIRELTATCAAMCASRSLRDVLQYVVPVTQSYINANENRRPDSKARPNFKKIIIKEIPAKSATVPRSSHAQKPPPIPPRANSRDATKPPDTAESKPNHADWHLLDVIPRLLDIVLIPIKQQMMTRQCGQPHDHGEIKQQEKLSEYCCKLIARIVAEMSTSATSIRDTDSNVVKNFVTPSRFMRVNQTRAWNTGNGSPDAICFTVDRPGVTLVGVCVYGGLGNYEYSVELLHDLRASADEANSTHCWVSVEIVHGNYTAADLQHDIVQLKFERPVPLKEDLRYAIRLCNHGGRTSNGDCGLPSVKGPDGTTFRFASCSLSFNGTTLARGQIPSLIYYGSSKNVSNSSESADNLLSSLRSITLRVASTVMERGADLFCTLRNELTAEDLRRNATVLQSSPAINILIPYTLANLDGVDDSKSVIKILEMIHKLLPHVAAMNLLVPSVEESSTTTGHYYTWLESDHPYKQATVTNMRVLFPTNVSWVVLEMDPRSITAQPEDSLTVYAVAGTPKHRCHCANEVRVSDPPFRKVYKRLVQLTNEGEVEELGEEPDGDGVCMHYNCTYVGVTPRLANNASDWPQKALLVPGNEVIFSLETASDYLTEFNKSNNEDNRFGFRCLCVGYEDTPLTTQRQGLVALEMELVYSGAACASKLLAPDIEIPPLTFSTLVEVQVQAMTGGSPMGVEGESPQDGSEALLLSRGLELSSPPTIHQVLDGQPLLRCVSTERQFLTDFVAGAESTAGGRLARWLAPTPHVEPSKCELKAPALPVRPSARVTIPIIVRDQYGENVSSPALKVEVVVQRLSAGSGLASNVDYQRHKIPDVPYQPTVRENMCFHAITMMKAYQEFSFEELRLASESWSDGGAVGGAFVHNGRIPAERLPVRENPDGSYVATWIPRTAGAYVFRCTLDDLPASQEVTVEVAESTVEPPERCQAGGAPPTTPPTKLRRFISRFSAGLRVRASPSLQAEELGRIPAGANIAFVEEVVNKDGTWVRLSAESVRAYTDEMTEVAWCIQHHRHLDRALLVPVEPTTPLPSQDECASIWGGYGEAREDLQLWAQDDNDGALTDITCLDDRAFPYGQIQADGSPFMLPGSSEPSKRSRSLRGEISSTSSAASSPKRSQRRSNGNADDWWSPLRQRFGDNTDINAIQETDIEPEPLLVETRTSRVAQTGTQTSPDRSDSMSAMQLYMGPSKLNQDLPGRLSPKPISRDRAASRARAYRRSASPPPLPTRAAPAPPAPRKHALSPAQAECLRAVFAALLWHEGIVHDAIACAAFLKFHPQLPKQGARVVTRPAHDVTPARHQRHSVEVSNAGLYLRIHPTTLETLTRSGIEASTSRMRNAVDTPIREEENLPGPSTDPAGSSRYVVNVLPPAMRALVALWDALYEADQLTSATDKLKKEEKNENGEVKPRSVIRKKKEWNTRAGRTPYSVQCDLCSGANVPPPLAAHMRTAHPGCKNPTTKGFDRTGTYQPTNPQPSQELQPTSYCGQMAQIYQLWYMFCEKCYEKAIKAAPSIRQAREKGGVARIVYERVELPGCIDHGTMKDNAIFLLDLAPLTNPEPISMSAWADSSSRGPPTPPGSVWQPAPPFQCLPALGAAPKAFAASDAARYHSLGRPMPPAVAPLPSAFGGLEGNAGSNWPRVHRSVSMGQAGGRDLANAARPALARDTPMDQDTLTGAGSSLLAQPSAALRRLIGCGDWSAGASLSAFEAPRVDSDSLMNSPVMAFIVSKRDLHAHRQKMDAAVRINTVRQYAFEAMNWLLRSATQPTCVHDVMWWFCNALDKFARIVPPPSLALDDNKEQNAVSESPRGVIPTASASAICPGARAARGARAAFHAFLGSVSALAPSLPPASAAGLQAVRCWALHYSPHDRTFLHRSQVFSVISKILSHSEDGAYEEGLLGAIQESFHSYLNKENYVWTCPDVTGWCDISVSSRQRMAGALTDGSTETFWESGDEDRNKAKWIQMTYPGGTPDDRPHILCVHLDNTRDTVNKTLLVSFLYSGGSSEMFHMQDVEVDPKTATWLCYTMPRGTSTSVRVRCELRGPEPAVRVRQVRVLGAPTMLASAAATPAHVLHGLSETDTLRVFRLLTSQVFGKLLEWDRTGSDSGTEATAAVEDGAAADDSDLREHVVGILFAGHKLTSLQRQVMTHIVSAIGCEAARVRDDWETALLCAEAAERAPPEEQHVRPPAHQQDNYCFEMLSLLLALSGSAVGRAHLAQRTELLADLLALLHTGSERVQRQVISLLRRMITEIPPQKMLAAVNYGNEMNSRVTLLDHLVCYLGKAITVQVKVKGTSGATPASVMMGSSVGQASPATWFMRGETTKKHAHLVAKLLSDMAEDKVSPAWGLDTRNALATYVSQVAQLSEADRRPTRCIAAPTVWVALAALCVCEQSHVEMINSSGDGRESRRGESDGRPLCSNHDDGTTAAVIECRTCGPLCAECDRFLHLNRAARTHHRQICKEEESAIRIDIHEGCGRAKLFWLLLLVDRRTFKGLAEFRGMESGVCDNGAGEGAAILPGPPGLAGTCRFCGTRGNSGLLAIGNVCADQQCQDHGKEACSRVLPCNHLCGGVRSERTCLPCLFGCAGATDAVPLRQDADDMCMICFTDPLQAAPAIQLKCGHVFHLHCCRKVLANKWIGPRITFSFSQCPICKEDMNHWTLEELLAPIRQLYDEVKRKALMRLEYEGCALPGQAKGKVLPDPATYAMERYAYYVCHKCGKAYFGGLARCEAETSGWWEPNELVCGACSDVAGARTCPKHGADFLEYKCRYCCSVAVFFCFGTSHFCNACHDDFQRVTSIPKHLLPQCPAGPKGEQLPGSSDECPLHVQHPPTGEEFALGCGVCRHAQGF
ncbi:E3 ubiquitin-protein ligase MYCBP2 isoform X7 [Spodoptera frugiperda]|uniref:RCR-type E3 ubiquitin transferase n=1 Tax=Spodoptera frugiperda TaxID=7108 RepID=A0A9R0E8F3_SPOFR|nr:E3 ubiquitin-protein ligase MYCBP2 isoform X7 [Spodoptera frugiperda]